MSKRKNKNTSKASKASKMLLASVIASSAVVPSIVASAQEDSEIIPAYSELVIKYIDEDSNEIKESKTINGEVGTKYLVEPPFIKGYNYISVTGNESGSFSESPTEIVYKYVKNTEPGVTVMGEVHVSYLDEAGEELKPNKFIRDKVGESYTTKAAVIEGYELVDIVGNQTGAITEDLTKVVYKYKKSKAEVVIGQVEVKYLDQDGKSVFSPITLKDKVGSDYETRFIPIDGYQFVDITGDAKGKITSEPKTVVYNYKKIDPSSTVGEIEVRYVDETNKDIKERLIIKDKVGAPYATAKVEIQGYEFVSSVGELTGKVKLGTSYIMYVYKKADPNKNPEKDIDITISYVDESGKEIYPKTTSKGKKGEYYTTKALPINGYTWVRTVGTENGIVGTNNIEVKYVYKLTQTLAPLPTNPGSKVGMGKTDTATLYFEADKTEVSIGDEVNIKYKIQSLSALNNSKLGIYSTQRDKPNSGVSELTAVNLTNNSNSIYEGTLKVKMTTEGEFNLTSLFTNNNESRQTIETSPVIVKVKSTSLPTVDYNDTLPEVRNYKVSSAKVKSNTSLYQLDSNGKFNKVMDVTKDTALNIYDTNKDYYKLTNGLFISKNDVVVYVGQGEARNGNVSVYDQSGKVVRTIQKGQDYKVYSFDSNKYNIGEGQYVRGADFNAYIFGWIKISKDITLYDKSGRVAKTLKAGETYRIFAVDQDSLNLGGGYSVKKQDDHYKFIAR